MEDKIKSLIATQMGKNPEEIHPGDSLQDDLNMDSLDRVELTMALEEEFNLDIPDEDAEKIVTVEDVIKYVANKKLNKPS